MRLILWFSVMANEENVVVAGTADPDLVDEIMRVIRRYCEVNKVVPSAEELRDMMLSVAALSHVRAGIGDDGIESSCDGFADSAREIFQDVTGARETPLLYACPATAVLH